MKSESALGVGRIDGVSDVVYLKKEAFSTLKTTQIAAEVSKLNAAMRSAGKNYVLIGFGRWGSSIPSLGVPVNWSDISEAKVIVECSLEDFRVDPSQGTHFFQNLTSFNVGYVNVDPFSARNDAMDFDILDSMPAVFETQYIRHVRFETPLQIYVDGHAGRALINCPGRE